MFASLWMSGGPREVRKVGAPILSAMLLARWLTSVLFALCLPLCLVLTNVRFAASEPRVQTLGFRLYDVAATTGVSSIELDEAARDLSRYFRDDRQALDTRVHIGGEEVALFNPREVGHMRDVKTLMQGVFRIQELSFVYIAAYVCFVVLWSRERSLRRFARLLVVAGLMTLSILGLAAAAMLVGFEQLFVQFHLLSFSNDLWQLNPATDRLIQMFPLVFWFQVSMVIGVVTMLEAALIAVGGFVYLRRARGPWRRGFGALERTSDAVPAR